MITGAVDRLPAAADRRRTRRKRTQRCNGRTKPNQASRQAKQASTLHQQKGESTAAPSMTFCAQKTYLACTGGRATYLLVPLLHCTPPNPLNTIVFCVKYDMLYASQSQQQHWEESSWEKTVLWMTGLEIECAAAITLRSVAGFCVHGNSHYISYHSCSLIFAVAGRIGRRLLE
jgi:hypothetical protein